MPSAWMTPEGKVIPIQGEHELEIDRIAGLSGPGAIYSGWVRLLGGRRGSPGLIDGMPEYIERNKESALEWLGWPSDVLIDAEQDDGHIISVQTSSDELLDRSVQSLMFRARMQSEEEVREVRVRRRAERDVRVRRHERRVR